jgi:hypothetical protein
MDIRISACNAAMLSVTTAGKPSAYRSIRATTSVVAAKTHMTSLTTLESECRLGCYRVPGSHGTSVETCPPFPLRRPFFERAGGTRVA